METEDDEDLRLVRASASLLDDLERYIPLLLWKTTKKHGSQKKLHQYAKRDQVYDVVQLIEPFQSEPQLLDSKLKILLPPLVDAYLQHLRIPLSNRKSSEQVSLDVAISRLLYTFCKVRGEKIVSGFLNNEPKYLEPILSALEHSVLVAKRDQIQWQVSYTLLIWLSHLLLAPFDLASVSAHGPSELGIPDIDLPRNLPDLVFRTIAIGIKSVGTTTREQDAAAKLLVRLVQRLDIQYLGLPSSLVAWACGIVKKCITDPSLSIDSSIGPLKFLVGISASVDSLQAAKFVPTIYSVVLDLLHSILGEGKRTSAVVKKLSLKIVRNIATLSLQPIHQSLASFFDTNDVVEDVIDFLLQALADRETPVRFAASKAISMIVMRLDPEMGHEVIQAVIDTFKQNTPTKLEGCDLGFSFVNALQWHGLTLTLAHNLFRRSAAPEQLPDILKALLQAIVLEQRAATGQSQGTNVRDAACFGLWSIARRYTTSELLSAGPNTNDITVLSSGQASIIQQVGTQLFISACLDPAGNVRRGCSAALQELIGRHPDQVTEGISLVQIVDYQAVGLRRRAMTEVAYKASALNYTYLRAVLAGLLDWRGLSAPDVHSREYAAMAIGKLCTYADSEQRANIIGLILAKVQPHATTSVEDKHGALLTIANMINASLATSEQSAKREISSKALTPLMSSWQLFNHHQPTFSDHNPRALKAQLSTAVASCITSLSRLSVCCAREFDIPDDNMQHVKSIVTSLISRSEETLLAVVPPLIQSLVQLEQKLAQPHKLLDIKATLHHLRMDSTRSTLYGAGRALALGAAAAHVGRGDPSAEECVKALARLLSAPVIEWRVIGLRALDIFVPDLRKIGSSSAACMSHILKAVDTGMTDYTITERGDVGSLVRVEAIKVVGNIWRSNLLADNKDGDELLHGHILRLSLEKLDRVRLLAAQCHATRMQRIDEIVVDVSSHIYFVSRLKPLSQVGCSGWEANALIVGCISSAGAGNESLLQTARVALIDVLLDSSAIAITAFLSNLTGILKRQIAEKQETQPTLDLLAFLLGQLPLYKLTHDTFNWRNLLAYVQKAHFKSTVTPRIVAAVDVYRELALIPPLEQEVRKKLMTMRKTNPFPHVTQAVEECLWCIDQHVPSGL